MDNLAKKLYSNLSRLANFNKSGTHGLTISNDMKGITYPEKIRNKIQQVKSDIQALEIRYEEKGIRDGHFIYQPNINFRIIIRSNGCLNFSALDSQGKWHIYCEHYSSYPYDARWYREEELNEIKFGKQVKPLWNRVTNILEKINEIQQDIKRYEVKVRAQKMEELFAAYI